MVGWRRKIVAVLAVVVGLIGAPPVAATGEPAPAGVGESWEMAVFLCVPSPYGCHKREATAKQKQALQTFLEAMPELSSVRFVSRSAAYAGFRRDFAGNKRLLARVKAGDLPESFRVQLTGVADRARVRAAIVRRPGVWKVEDFAESYGDPRVMTAQGDVSVFLCLKDTAVPACLSGRGRADGKATTTGERKAIVAAIERTPGVESYFYEDQATAYRKFSEMYADRELLVEVTNVSDMPMSYRLMMRAEADWDAASARMARMPGVSQVNHLRCHHAQVKLVVEYGPSDESIKRMVCAY